MSPIDTTYPANELRERDLTDSTFTGGQFVTSTVNGLARGPGPRLLTANTLQGNRIINPADQTLGHVEEIMLDTERGRIAYVVMASGGFLGLGERLFAIPWAALTLDPDRQCFLLDASKDHFDHAPGFDKHHWPSMADRGWHEDVHEYYSARPYWF